MGASEYSSLALCAGGFPRTLPAPITGRIVMKHYVALHADRHRHAVQAHPEMSFLYAPRVIRTTERV